MSDVVIQVEGLSKQYRLGEVSTGSLHHDINRWWHRIRGKEDPYLSVTGRNIRTGKLEGGANANHSDYVWALRDINFEVKRGEVLGIIGRNGAGKSTLLKILSRITAPTTGEVRIKGRIGALLEVGTGFHQDLTGRENIYLNGAILGMTRAEVASKLDDIVEFSGCALYLDTPVKRYSSGMVVRLAFAVAAHLDPEILIVDEVLAVGDMEFQKKCIGKMSEVASHGRTVLFVSHNITAVQNLCSSCLLLSNGMVELAGSTPSVIQEYIRSSERETTNEALSSMIKHVSVFTEDAANGCEATPDQDLHIQIEVELEDQVISDPTIGIGFDTELGFRVFTAGSLFSENKLPELKGRVVIRGVIKDHHLSPGKYWLKVAVGNGRKDLDAVDRAAQITIVGNNYFGSGEVPSLSQGVVWVKSQWSVDR